MTIREHRLSTTVVQSDWISPDERTRSLDEDYEAGPIALNDTSQGLKNQVWHLTWDFASGDFTATPETTGSPQVVLNATSVTQCSLAFDQNAHINIAYTSGGVAFLYWYDTVADNWTTTQLGSSVITPTLTLDDKRQRQTNSSDVLLWYTKQNPDGSTNLYTKEQRDRYLIEYDMGPFPRYLYKLGMNVGFRVQVGGSDIVI